MQFRQILNIHYYYHYGRVRDEISFIYYSNKQKQWDKNNSNNKLHDEKISIILCANLNKKKVAKIAKRKNWITGANKNVLQMERKKRKSAKRFFFILTLSITMAHIVQSNVAFEWTWCKWWLLLDSEHRFSCASKFKKLKDCNRTAQSAIWREKPPILHNLHLKEVHIWQQQTTFGGYCIKC